MRAADLRGRLGAASRGQILVVVVAMAASFAIQLWVGRRLGPSGLGAYHAVALLVIAIATVVQIGLPLALSQRVAELESAGESGDRATRAGALLAILVAFIAAVVGVLIWIPFSSLSGLAEDLPAWLIAAALSAAVLQYFVVSVLIARLAVRSVLAIVLAHPAAVGVGMSLSYFGPLPPGSMLAVGGYLGAGAVAVVLARLAGISPGFDRSETELLVRRALPSTIVPYVLVIAPWIDRAIVLGLLGPVGLGQYAAASLLPEAAIRILRSGGTFAVSVYARVAQAGASARVLDSHLRLISSYLLVAGSALIATRGDLVVTLFGEGFRRSATAFQLLNIAVLPMALSFALIVNLVGTGKSRHEGPLMGVLIVVQAGIVWAGTELLTVAGAALAQVLVWAIVATVHVLLHATDLPVRVATIGRIAGVAIPLWAFAVVLGFTEIPWVIRAVIGAAVGTTVVSTVLLGRAELRVVTTLLSTRRQ